MKYLVKSFETNVTVNVVKNQKPKPKINYKKWVKVFVGLGLVLVIILLVVFALLLLPGSDECNGDKQVLIYKFFINGHDGDSGPHGEYQIRLDGQKYYPR